MENVFTHFMQLMELSFLRLKLVSLSVSLPKAQVFHMKLCFVFQLFHGNWEGATVVKNAILFPFEARFVRFIPNECSEDDCLLEAEAYLLIKGSQGFKIISL